MLESVHKTGRLFSTPDSHWAFSHRARDEISVEVPDFWNISPQSVALSQNGRLPDLELDVKDADNNYARLTLIESVHLS